MVSIFSNSWIDLVFEGRNQQYGAFELRKKTPRNSIAAGLISLSLLGMAIVTPLIVSLFIGHHPQLVIVPPDIPPVLIPYPIIDAPPPAAPKAPPSHATTAAVPLVVAPDEQVAVPDVAPTVPQPATTGTEGQNQPGDNSPGTTTSGIPVGNPAPEEDNRNKEPLNFAEIMPAFPGGDPALLKYVADHTEYPDVARENGVEGTVYVQFVVDRQGNVTNVKVIHPVDRFLDREAIRVISSLPRWTPGRQNGKEVPVQCVVPIKFQLK